tara:strand:+ start:1334 stop:1645 length:312 start_codon:yes stop_codon:yes gene_type:complete
VRFSKKGEKMNLNLNPKHPWITVNLSFDEKEDRESTVILPEEYKPSEAPYKAVSVETDSEGEYRYGDVVVVPTHVIREVVLRNNTHYLIERNHVMAEVVSEGK